VIQAWPLAVACATTALLGCTAAAATGPGAQSAAQAPPAAAAGRPAGDASAGASGSPASGTYSSPFLGAPSYVDPSRKQYSVAEHPYVFIGRLGESKGACDASLGMTFRNVTTLAANGAECTYDVAHDEVHRTTTLAAICTLVSDQGGVHAITKRLAVSDDVQVGKDNPLPVRSAFFTLRTEMAMPAWPTQRRPKVESRARRGRGSCSPARQATRVRPA
jgi:hypothetical protein